MFGGRSCFVWLNREGKICVSSSYSLISICHILKPKVYEIWDNALSSVLKEQFFKNTKQCVGLWWGLLQEQCMYISEVYVIYTHMYMEEKFLIWEEKLKV